MDSIFFYRSPESAALPDGILKGLKIAIQPNISVQDWPTEAGSGALANFKALEDATLIRRLKLAGACLCGSTRMSEFGFGLCGSKAGEALKNKAADAELVLDLMGEARLAAAGSSVCGFKPSWGLVSHFGLIGLIASMEDCGILSENINHIRSIIKTVAGPDESDFSLPDAVAPDFTPTAVNLEKTTIGVIAETIEALADEKQNIFRHEVGNLKKQGLIIKELSLPDFSLFLTSHKIVGSVEASSAAGRYDSVRYGQRSPGAKNWNEMYLSSRGAAFGLLMKSFLFQGAYFQFQNFKAYEDACRLRARLIKQMEIIFTQADFLLLPTFGGASTDTPASLDETYAQFAQTAFANVTGQPALYLPPVSDAQAGLQLAGPRLGDAALLNLGEHLQNLRRGGK